MAGIKNLQNVSLTHHYLQGGRHTAACVGTDHVNQSFAHTQALGRDFGIALCHCSENGFGECRHVRLPDPWIALFQCHAQELQRLYPELRAVAAPVLQRHG